MKKAFHVFVIAAIVAGYSSTFFACSRDTPPPTPEEKLNIEIQDLQDSIRLSKHLLDLYSIEIQQKIVNKKYEVAKAISEAQFYDANVNLELVRSQKVAALNDDLEISRELLRMEWETLKINRGRLEEAKEELQRLTGGSIKSGNPQ